MRHARQQTTSLFGTLLLFAVACMAARCGESSNPVTPTVTLSAVSVAPASVTAGGTAQVTVTLSGSAPTGGAIVNLSSSSVAVTVPGSVTVAAGASTATAVASTSSSAGTGPATITATYSGATRTASLTVTAVTPTVRADFTVTPDPLTGANPGQCAAVSTTFNGQLVNQLKCTFDGSISTPNPGITAYNWTLPSGASGTAMFTGVVLNSGSITVPCGSFGSADREVSLTVTAPAGTSTTTRTVTFFKPNAC
jgi:hypothetical protein